MSFQMRYNASIIPGEKTLNVLIRNFDEYQSHQLGEIKFPVNFSDINKFEKHNSSISINVFGYEKAVYHLKISKHNYKRESTVNIL